LILILRTSVVKDSIGFATIIYVNIISFGEMQ